MAWQISVQYSSPWICQYFEAGHICQILLASNVVSASSYSGVSFGIIKSGHILIVITFSTFNLWNVSEFMIISLVEHAVYLTIIAAFIQMSSCNFDPINDCQFPWWDFTYITFGIYTHSLGINQRLKEAGLP